MIIRELEILSSAVGSTSKALGSWCGDQSKQTAAVFAEQMNNGCEGLFTGVFVVFCANKT